MAAQTLKLLGKQYVIMPKREYDRMQAELGRQVRQDRGDVAEAQRRAKEKSIPLTEVRRRIRNLIDEKLYEAIDDGQSTPMTQRDWAALRGRVRKPRRRRRAG